MDVSYNLRNPAVKRLMKEAEELRDATEEYYAQPLEGNLFEWHFTVRGPPKTDFDGGIYHGRITLPPDYPMKPPSIILLTPNGRFEVNKKICLSISGHHPESWQPSWSIRTALLAIIGFMPTHGNGAIGSLDYSSEERQILALKSRLWVCPECGPSEKLLLPELCATSDSETEQFTSSSSEMKSSASSATEADSSEIIQLNNEVDFKNSQDEGESLLSDLSHSASLTNSESVVLQNFPRARFNLQQQYDTPVFEQTHNRNSSEMHSGVLWTTVCIRIIIFLLIILLIRRLLCYY